MRTYRGNTPGALAAGLAVCALLALPFAAVWMALSVRLFRAVAGL